MVFRKSRRKWFAVATVAAFAAMLPVMMRPARGTTPFVMTNIPTDQRLSVMTYNVEGLPFPVRIGRSDALQQIGARLDALRLQGAQPHIVVLQEAFSADAKNIGRAAGYRYVIDGPDEYLAGEPATDVADKAFADEALFIKGERSGKMLDSGLQILSDYPIRSVRRMAFPTYACGGYDCLANKGAMIAMIAVPGIAEPVAVVNVHLNSGKSSHVSRERSFYAYSRQIDALDRFLAATIKPGTPIIMAGDFNVGHRANRERYFEAHILQWGRRAPGQIRDALRTCYSEAAPCGPRLPEDAAFSMKRARDWQLSVPGDRISLAAKGVTVPFGHDLDGSMLSDHVGYMAYYEAVPVVKSRPSI